MATKIRDVAAAGQPDQQTLSQAQKRKTDELEPAAPASPTPNAKKAKTESPASIATNPHSNTKTPRVQPVTKAATKTPAQPRKRKAAPSSAAPDAPAPKKTKQGPRQPRQPKKLVVPPPAAASPRPAPITPAVRAKIASVKRFLATEMEHEASHLVREKGEGKRVAIPERDLMGVVLNMYSHWQMGDGPGDLGEVWGSVVGVYEAELGSEGLRVGWVVLDFGMGTELEGRIREKVKGHGLEGVGLLEVEMEMCARVNRARWGVYEWAKDRDEEDEEAGENGVVREEGERVEMRMWGGIEAEVGRTGVCPGPMVEVV